jgi:ribosome biogenesis SPOUT family RNA methylase Rps3
MGQDIETALDAALYIVLATELVEIVLAMELVETDLDQAMKMVLDTAMDQALAKVLYPELVLVFALKTDLADGHDGFVVL